MATPHSSKKTENIKKKGIIKKIKNGKLAEKNLKKKTVLYPKDIKTCNNIWPDNIFANKRTAKLIFLIKKEIISKIYKNGNKTSTAREAIKR